MAALGMGCGLQCGRGWLTAEGNKQTNRWEVAENASMWPRLVNRGRKAVGSVVTEIRMLQCGRGWLTAEGDDVHRADQARRAASMWPRLVNRGRGEGDGFVYGQYLLQCGRGWLTAEGGRSSTRSSAPTRFNVAAVG